MYLTDDLMEKYCIGILDNLSVRDTERDDVFGGYDTVGRKYEGYGLTLYQHYNPPHGYCGFYVKFNGRKVYESDGSLFFHGDWEQILYELYLKTPDIAVQIAASDRAKRTRINGWKKLCTYLKNCDKYLPMESEYHIRRSGTGTTTNKYVDDVVKVVQIRERDFCNLQVFIPEIIREKRWYGTKEVCQYKLVFDNSDYKVFSDGGWRRHLIDLIETEKARIRAEEDEQCTSSAKKYLDMIRKV